MKGHPALWKLRMLKFNIIKIVAIHQVVAKGKKDWTKPLIFGVVDSCKRNLNYDLLNKNHLSYEYMKFIYLNCGMKN